MPAVRKSVIVAQSCEVMFALVDEVERYPEFLPWCPSTEVFERTDEITRARLDIDYHGLTSHITTLNRKRPPMEAPFGPVFGDIIETLVDRFVEQAEAARRAPPRESKE